MPGAVAITGEPPVPRNPVKFADLYEANARLTQQVNIMGVVVDFLPPSHTRGTDLQCSFTLQDSVSWTDDSDLDHSAGGLKVKFFRPSAKALPRVQSVGDIVLLRSIKITNFNGNTIALSGLRTEWTVFPGRLMPQMNEDHAPRIDTALARWSSNSAPKVNPEEEAYAVWLRHWSLQNEFFRGTIGQVEATKLAADPSSSATASGPGMIPAGAAGPALSPAAPTRNRFITLSEASDGRFCDLVAEVIKVFETGMGKEVYITDYTENRKFFNYSHPTNNQGRSDGDLYMHGDEYGYLGAAQGAHKDWPGPWGQFVLCVMLFHPHATAEVKEHDIVSIRNLRCVNSKTGTHLEGKLHQDRHRPDQIDISKLKSNRALSGPMDVRLTALRERKDDYWREHGINTAIDGNGGVRNGGVSRAEKKRRQKRKREELKRQAGDTTMAKEPSTSNNTKSNKHVRCSYPDKAIVPLSEIIDNGNRLYSSSSGTDVQLPFINMMCRAHVRVVDFFPPNIEDFASLAPVSPNSDEDEPTTTLQTRWQWAFYLLVEDAGAIGSSDDPPRLKLLVAGDAADFLLKLDATNLRENKSTFQRLKLYLSFIWGDLDEVKAKHKEPGALPRPSNVPFECCIQEYGLPDPDVDVQHHGWKAVHRIVQTTVSTSYDED